METAVIVSLVIAILSAIISLFTAAIPAWLNHVFAEWTATAKSNADFNTHKEPVLIAAIDLAHELFNFLEAGNKEWIYWTSAEEKRKRYNSTAYLCYLFAIFFARVDALQKGVQLLNLGKSNVKLYKVLYDIQLILFQKPDVEDQPCKVVTKDNIGDQPCKVVTRNNVGDQPCGVVRRDDVQAMVEAVGPKPNGSKDKDKPQRADLIGYATFFNLLHIDKYLIEVDSKWPRMPDNQPKNPHQKKVSTKFQAPPSQSTIHHGAVNTKFQERLPQSAVPYQEEADTDLGDIERYESVIPKDIEDPGDGIPLPPPPPAGDSEQLCQPQPPKLEKIPSRSSLPTVSKSSSQPNIYRNYSDWFKPLLDELTDISRASRPTVPISQNERNNADFFESRLRQLQHRLINLIKKLDPDGKRVELKEEMGDKDPFRPVEPPNHDVKKCGCDYACSILSKERVMIKTITRKVQTKLFGMIILNFTIEIRKRKKSTKAN